MTVNRKVSGTAASIPEGLAAGVLTSVTSMLIGTFICALMIDKEMLLWKNTGYAVMCILILSAWLGAAVSIQKIKRRRVVMGIASGVLYYFVLLIMTGLFFGGKYSGVVEGGLLIFCGSMLGTIMRYPANSGRNKRKIRRRNG